MKLVHSQTFVKERCALSQGGIVHPFPRFAHSNSLFSIEDMLIGAAIGAGVGAAGGAILGGGKGAGKGAGIGGLVGATAGTLYGLNEARYAAAYQICAHGRGFIQ